MNGTQAAISAGYSKKTAKEIASELLQKPDIKELITASQNLTSEKLSITREGLLKDLQKAMEMAQIVNEKTGQPNTSAYISAIEAQAKMLGFNAAEKHENSYNLDNLTLEEKKMLFNAVSKIAE